MIGSTSLLDSVANTVANASKTGKRLIDQVKYMPDTDSVLVICFPLAVLIDRKDIPELRNLDQHQIENITLSASGATIKVEEANIYIEAASLLSRHLRELKVAGRGGLIVDLLTI